MLLKFLATYTYLPTYLLTYLPTVGDDLNAYQPTNQLLENGIHPKFDAPQESMIKILWININLLGCARLTQRGADCSPISRPSVHNGSP